MNLPDFLIDKYKDWKVNSFEENKAKYEKSAIEKQKPKAMIISCCDSRFLETKIFAGNIGDYFIHRNIANIVPPFDSKNIDSNTSSALEYAVKSLKVPHIVIMGHSNCGGVNFACERYLKNSKKNEFEFLNKWIENLSPIFKYNNLEIQSKNKNTFFEQENIKLSIKNIQEYPFVKEKLINDQLFIHGLWYEIKSGRLMSLNKVKNIFEELTA